MLLFLTILVVYIRTLNPALFRNDSPETITACVTLGISHPPGYPLHTLLGHLFSWILIGNPAMTLNFFSAVLGALGACLLAANLWLLQKNSGQPYRLAAALAGASAFAFSKNYWSASLAAKGGIYVLQADLELAFFYFLQLCFLIVEKKEKSEGNGKPLVGALFLFALGLTNHWPTQVLTLPALATLALTKIARSSQTRFKLVTLAPIHILAFILLVLSLYLYLPLRAGQFPVLNFGAPTNWHRFLACLFRADYSKVETMASATPAEFSALGAKAFYLSDHFLNEFNCPFLVLTVLGLWGLLRRKQESLALFLLTLLLTTLVVNVLYLRVAPLEFWHLDDHTLSLNWVLGILGGCGAGQALEWLGTMIFFETRSFARTALCSLVVVGFPVWLFLGHRDVNNQSREFLYWGYGMTALKSMDLNARYFAESDYDYFSILYLQEVEHRRPDVRLKMTTFMAKNDWDNLAREVSTNTSSLGHPIYCAFPNGDFISGYLKHCPTACLEPVGTIIQFMPIPHSINKKPFTGPLEDFWEKYLAPDQRTTNPIDGLLLELCAHPYLNMANYLALRADVTDWRRYYRYGVSLIQEPKFQAETWEALGDADLKSKEEMQAIAEYLQAANEYRLVGITSKEIECLRKENSIGSNNFSTSWWMVK